LFVHIHYVLVLITFIQWTAQKLTHISQFWSYSRSNHTTSHLSEKIHILLPQIDSLKFFFNRSFLFCSIWMEQLFILLDQSVLFMHPLKL
jgi:hypothetical protein